MTTTIKEVCERVYAGRRQLRELGCDPDLRNVEIMIGHETWAHLIIEHREVLRRQNRYEAFRVLIAVEEPTPGEFLIFGLRARPSNDLGPNEIRFRSEVTL